ncbi:MAG: thermonuclease family protein [Solirubrobacteraceae bacterium]
MVIAFLISLVAAYLLPATPAATTCSHRLDAATARDRVGRVEINCETLPCPCLAPDPRAGGDEAGGEGGRGGGSDERARPQRRSQRIKAKITEVVDGDTVKVRAYGARRKRYSVRLIGIDTPETRRPGVAVECGGRQASSNMYRLAFRKSRDTDGDELRDDGSRGRRVVLRTDPTQDLFDRYDRLLAYVTTRAGVSLQKRQLRAGRAEVYVYGGTPFRQVRLFRRAERAARRADRGVWDECRGDFHRPADDARASASARRYRGYVDLFDGDPTHEGYQGNGWRAVFRERTAGRVRYRVCLRHLGNGERRCWNRRTNGRGVSRVFAALFVNDQGGPGRWRARWTVEGERVASWRFRVRPEFG